MLWKQRFVNTIILFSMCSKNLIPLFVYRVFKESHIVASNSSKFECIITSIKQSSKDNKCNSVSFYLADKHADSIMHIYNFTHGGKIGTVGFYTNLNVNFILYFVI